MAEPECYLTPLHDISPLFQDMKHGGKEGKRDIQWEEGT